MKPALFFFLAQTKDSYSQSVTAVSELNAPQYVILTWADIFIKNKKKKKVVRSVTHFGWLRNECLDRC